MNTTAHTSTAERLGRTFGRGWRAYARGERRASNWLVSKGRMPVAGATLLLWLVKLAVLGMLLYFAFWLTLLLGFALTAGWMATRDTTEEESDLLGRQAEEQDHREGIFYHPALHNDDPDPRFEDN